MRRPFGSKPHHILHHQVVAQSIGSFSDQELSPGHRAPLTSTTSSVVVVHQPQGPSSAYWGTHRQGRGPEIVDASCGASQSSSTSYYNTPRLTDPRFAPGVGGRSAAIPPPAVTYKSPLSQQASPGSGYLTRRVMVTPRSRIAPQTYILPAQSPPQFALRSSAADMSPSNRGQHSVGQGPGGVVAPSPDRSSSPAFRHQTLIYRPPPLSARRAMDPVSSSQSRLTDSSFSPPIRFLPYERNGVRQFADSFSAHPEPWMHSSDLSSASAAPHGYGGGGGDPMGDRKKRRTRIVAAAPGDLNHPSSSSCSRRRTPVTQSNNLLEAPSSSAATTTESALSPRRLVYPCQTPRAADPPPLTQHAVRESSSSSSAAAGPRGLTLDSTWGSHGPAYLDSSQLQGELGIGMPLLDTPRLGASGIPRLPLRHMHDWSSPPREQPIPQEQRSQPVVMGPPSFNRSVISSAAGYHALGTVRLTASRHNQHQAPVSSVNNTNSSGTRFAQPTTSRPALSSRVHLQTAGGRQELSLRPIPHKRVVAAGTLSASTRTYGGGGSSRQGGDTDSHVPTSGTTSTSSQPISRASGYPDLSGGRNKKREAEMSSSSSISRQAPLSARPTLAAAAAASCTRNVGSVSTRGAGFSGCLTARPATQDNRRYFCNDLCGSAQLQRPIRSTTQQKQQPRTAMSSVALPDTSRGGQPSSSLSQTSTANDSQSSTKLDGGGGGGGETDAKYRKRVSLNSRERIRASLISRQPLRSSIRDVPSLASFETIAMIGQGGYAVVRVVRHRASKQIFALKQVAKVDFTSVAQLRMAFTEVDILCAQEKLSKRIAVAARAGTRSKKALMTAGPHGEAERRLQITDYVRENGHKYFPKFFNCWQDEHFIFFLMEYLPGGDLMKHLIDREIFSEPVAKFYTAQIAVATGFMHDHLLYVHRDIKPDNVLFDTNGHTKLVDFGLSRVLPYRLGTSSRPKFTEAFQSAVGTPDYMAPEVHRPGVAHDRTIDWWSLGIILYEMLFGGPPLSDLHHRPEVTSQLIRNWKSFLTSWPKVPPVSNTAKDLLSKLIAEKEDRLKTVEDVLSHPWFSDLNLEELRTMRAPIVPKTFGPTDVRNFDSFTPSKLLQWEDKKMRGVLPAEVAAMLMEARKSPLTGDTHSRTEGPHIPYVPSRPSTNRSTGESAGPGGSARPTTTDPIMAKTLFQSSASTYNRSRNSLSQTTAPRTMPNKTSPGEEDFTQQQHKLLHRTPPQRPIAAGDLTRRMQALESISRSSGGRLREGPSLDSVNRSRTETVLHQRRMEPSVLANAAVLLQQLGKSHALTHRSQVNRSEAPAPSMASAARGDASRPTLDSGGINSLSSSDPSAVLSNTQSNHPGHSSSNQEQVSSLNRPEGSTSNHTSKLASQVASAGTDLYPPSTSDITSSAGDKQQPDAPSTLLSGIKTKFTRWLTASASSSSASEAAAVLQVDPPPRPNAAPRGDSSTTPFHSLKQAAGVQCEPARGPQHDTATFPLQHKMRSLAAAKE